MELATPDGSSVELTLVSRQDRLARLETDAETWDRIHAAGLFNTGGTHTEHPFEPGIPVELELELDPTADDETSTESWWARTVTQSLPVPAELEGELREGVKFPDPPWAGGLQQAWSAMTGEPLLDLVTGVFLGQDWDVERPEPEATVIQVVVPDDVGDFELYVRTVEDQHLVTVMSIIRADVPAGQLLDVFELAARLNGQLSVGSFEVDPDTGLLSFKVGIDVEGDALSVALVRQMVGHAIVAAQRAAPLLAGVLRGDETPRGAANRL